MRSCGITLQEINKLFDYLKESNNNSETTIFITNDMCKELYNLFLNSIEYQKIKNKEIERLNNIIKIKTDFIEELLKIIAVARDYELHDKCYTRAKIYEERLQELKGVDKE